MLLAVKNMVDAAVQMVEQGDAPGAVSILREGITTFQPKFPDRSREVAHDITFKAFGPGSLLVGHRSLRLGVVYFAQGRINEAASPLHTARETLQARNDPAQFEATLYMDFTLLAGTKHAGQVAQLGETILSSFKQMASIFGPESLVTSLALAQHDRLVHAPLAVPEPDPLLCETLLRQHASAITSWRMICCEGIHTGHVTWCVFIDDPPIGDMLHDAESLVRQAGDALRQIYPDDSDLMVMCKHRLGMICATGADHRAATKLLQISRDKYQGGGGSGAGLAKEADVGLAFAKYRALPAHADAEARTAALKEVRHAIDRLATAIGPTHMLSKGALRHLARMMVSANVTL
ncbi:hypothetical protein DUNSADRAFT_6822 [Dunaliella salina]|uniref:Uncharacterized protein n=1 Tax=Dunaliella salina TaxID=3046 RepID=A0ABQ7GMN9_DUNSA|nr:hypothetical protein DUNSADRAFT_6822 [Dunaliella salina]|eukprot:KAF5835833.1 hypothetical protein DUNSADRAFT_6822 [Dunaliella salina]